MIEGLATPLASSLSEEEVLVARGPAEVQREWRERPASASVNWHGVAEACAFRAGRCLDAGTKEKALEWAEAAVTLYDWLASIHRADSFVCSAMQIRASMIGALGVDEQTRARSLAALIGRCREVTTGSPDDAVVRAEQLRQEIAGGAVAPKLVDRLRKSRALKNRLAPLVYVANAVELPEDIKQWLSVRERL
jgi:hypothetical protein